jgi:hypothetical protein
MRAGGKDVSATGAGAAGGNMTTVKLGGVGMRCGATRVQSAASALP